MKLFLTLSLILHCSLLAVQKPNVVLFLVDDMGAMDTSLPFLTDEKGIPVKHPLNHFYRTPNMERLAAQGTRFSQFYAQSVCSPTRISIMTGQNATRHRTTNWIRPAGNNRSKFTSVDWNWNGLTKSSLTLSRLLAESGYQNIHVGKGHFGPYDHEGQDPLNLGFHVNIGGDSIGQPGSYYGEKNYGNEVKGKDDTANTYGVSHLTNYHGSDTFLSEALTIEAKKAVTHATEEKKPFYLYMAHYALHAPFHSDPRFAKNYLESGKPKKAQAYATLVEGMDKSLGDLLDHLNSLGVGEDTLVLFLGDNGGDAPLGGAHDYGSSAPLRGKKGAHYEGGTRAPFIAAWAKPNPSNPHQKKLPIAQGVTQTQLATVMDLFPTILNLVGQEIPNDHPIDAHDLKAQFTGTPNPARPEIFLSHFPHEHRSNYYTGFRNGDWKLIYHYPVGKQRLRYELFNLRADPFEKENLSTKNPTELKRLFAEMMTHLKAQGALFPVADGREVLPVAP
ncbi:sulfatase-like hydrolase/transferase [Akkermansiaceae bacterium]|nr:sulfatase-like hydrolase/transferase [Akkermansiaceae bacterium]MDB4326094.1 sulfatase-like hydrolase/transferase [bacterium]MDB4455839.1 sulfatase-like hydrolase/transferase [bacterium]MDB4619755.1 sulfatase-like hydrolase/transferase [Akkermansiaceae bacterium]MDB4692402.1 sulfatase-like hydrolase/transferase [Akkermansiaceae bacterium]